MKPATRFLFVVEIIGKDVTKPEYENGEYIASS